QLGLPVSRVGLASSPGGMPQAYLFVGLANEIMLARPTLDMPTISSPRIPGSMPRRQAMSTYPTFSPRVIGQAEKTLNAILGRQLAGTGLTEPQWVILTLAVTSGGTAGRDQFTRTVAGALKISETEARARIADMVTAQQLQITGAAPAVTATGA